MLQDNGLLKHYNSNKLFSKRDLLSIKMFKIDKEIQCSYGSNLRAKVLTKDDNGNEVPFYLKQCFDGENDAEVLLSQVYARAGFKTAIYTPVKFSGMKNCVISNNIATPDTLPYANYDISSIEDFKDEKATMIAPFALGKNYHLFFSPVANSNMHYERYFTRDAIRQILKMRIFDTASFNTDRHNNNFFLNLRDDDTYEEITGNTRICDDITLFDYGYSGIGWDFYKTPHKDLFSIDMEYVNKSSQKGCTYYHDFERSALITRLTADKIIENFKTNETVRQFVSMDELSAELSCAGQDIPEVAREIKDTLDYEIKQEFVDKLQENFDNMANELVR